MRFFFCVDLFQDICGLEVYIRSNITLRHNDLNPPQKSKTYDAFFHSPIIHYYSVVNKLLLNSHIKCHFLVVNGKKLYLDKLFMSLNQLFTNFSKMLIVFGQNLIFMTIV